MRPTLLLPALLLGCASVPALVAPPAPPAPSGAPSAVPVAAIAPAPASYAAIFDELVARIERDHSFPPRYTRDVGHPWSDDVPRLRAEFAHATDRQEALVALRHLQNSLRDAHCDLSAPGDLPERWIRIGLRVWAGGTTAAPEVRVSEVLDPDAKDQLAPGDAILAIDGVPIAAWYGAHPFETDMLAPRSALSDTSRAIVFAQLPWSTVKDGDTRVLGVVHDGKPRDVTMHFRRSFPQAEGPTLDRPPPVAKIDYRLPIHVRGPESEDLGTLRVALSESELKEGVTVEGDPLALDWEANDTFETRKTWVKDAVEQARTRLTRLKKGAKR